jgi:hypothetical protein
MKKMSTTVVFSVSLLLVTSCSKTKDEEGLVKPDAISVTQETLSHKEALASYANGEATLSLAYLNGVQHFTFHATKDAEGNVTGSWESKSPGQLLRTHGTLTCLTFIDDKTAYMTGVVTHKVGEGSPGQYEVGMPVWFKVRDNGEGDNSNPDEFTDYYSLDGIQCVNYEQASIHPVINGNIQVRR